MQKQEQQGQECFIRDSTDEDMGAVTDIYSWYVENTTVSLELQSPSLEDMTQRRQDLIANRFPYIVACIDAQVVGYGYLGAYNYRAGYQCTCSNSIYVKNGITGNGIGTKLLKELITRCNGTSLRQMVALISEDNPGSVTFHSRLGFEVCGRLKSVGAKFGKWRTVTLMQKSLNGGDTTSPPELNIM